MESIRECPSCKTKYPKSFTGTVCPSCHAEFTEQWCKTCDTWKPSDEFYLKMEKNGKAYRRRECKNCGRLRKLKFDKDHRDQRYERDKRFHDKRKASAEERYATWVARIVKLPTRVLSETEWLEACRYFNGCAVCGARHIETRQYFVPFKEGGSYSAWNIFPMCGKCSTATRMLLNPFLWLDRYSGYASNMGITEYRANRLINYFELQIERVENNGQQNASI